MEETILILSKTLGSFCNHLQTSCDALKQSVDRRPIPLDSASSTFIQCLNRRVSSASTDLNLLESMSFGTVSFEELLGHCNEVYKKNQTDLIQLEDRLKSFGYAPEVEIEDEDEPCSTMAPSLDSENGLDSPSYNVSCSIIKSLEEDPLMDESLSLKSLGLSEVCLATLASEAKDKIDNVAVSAGDPKRNCDGELPENLKPFIQVSKDDYEGLPSYMKSLTSWEELLTAIETLNSSLGKKETSRGHKYLHQDEIASMGLGPKARTYLLVLMRMNQFVVETIDGVISYKVLQTRCDPKNV